MRLARLVVLPSALLILGASVGAPLGAQIVPSLPRDVRSEYLSLVSVRIGEELRTWSKALNAGDAAKAASIIDADAHLLTSTGQTMRGRKAFEQAYVKLRGRVQNVQVEKLDVTQSGEMAFMSGRLKYEVNAVRGGSYTRETTVGMAFKETRYGWRLVSQVGGDFAPLAEVVRPLAVRAPGARDTLAVRVTDAFGTPIPMGRVVFTVLAGDGSVELPAVMTDEQGIARVAFVAGNVPGRQVVQAVATMIDEEPLLFEATTEAVTAERKAAGEPGR